MTLTHLLDRLALLPSFQALAHRLGAQANSRARLLQAATPPVIALLARDRPVLVVTPTASVAAALGDDLAIWLDGSGRSVEIFADPESGGYQRIAARRERVRARLRALAALRAGSGIVIATQRALLHPTATPEEISAQQRTLTRGSRSSPDALARWLLRAGFVAEPAVEEPGSFAVRGGLLDVFSPIEDRPVRLEFFGDEIDTLRPFDPATQRSDAPIERYALSIAHEAGLVSPVIDPLLELALDDLTELEREAWQRDQAALLAGIDPADAPFFAALINRTPLPAHAAPGTLLVTLGAQLLAAVASDLVERAEAERADLEARGEFPRAAPRPYLEPAAIAAATAPLASLDLTAWEARAGAIDVEFDELGTAPLFGGRLRAFAGETAKRLRRGEQIVVASPQAPRLSQLLAKEGVALDGDRLAISAAGLGEGWRLAGAVPLVLLTDAEIFGIRRQQRAARRVPRRPLADELTPGDFVVHIDHGIGRFAGTRLLTFDGKQREYLEIEYGDQGKVYVPTDQIELVSRYVGPGDQPPRLNKLGTQDWIKTRRRVRRAVGAIARELLTLYAARQLAEGYAFGGDTPWQQELEGSFPYVETDDQLRVLADVKQDMESQRPMDRLVCGDVGFGKTEVALRAAFKAVMDGKQVGVLVPTTVLAQQHLRTFSERMEPFPIRVELLSRFRTPAEQKGVLKDLAAGSVDIVIGTHRLLQKDVRFERLGLLVVDEEQRFGVGHKERLKQLRQNVDVLTLSATPIPRTLHMSLVGVRDMSSLDTPPEDRLPIKTYVAEFDEGLIRDAIEREIGRGGQVFLVHNRVQNIQKLAILVNRLVPDARVAVGHGQMAEDKLEQIMLDFADQRYDVLVSTTIIESGLDIPNANTIIINNADRFGLAQLYQLRGRVGRSASRAYAYLLFEGHRQLSEVAEKRLRTIFEATDLGSGIRIAMRDLEMRGAGNLLGAEQSGHIADIGFELYARMLADAVSRMKRIVGIQGLLDLPPDAPDPDSEVDEAEALALLAEFVRIDIPVEAHLPAAYLPELNLRLETYQRLAAARSLDELDELVAECTDRFGPLPAAARLLVALDRLRLRAGAAGVRSVKDVQGTLTIQLDQAAALDRLAVVQALPRGASFGTDQIRLPRPSSDEAAIEAVGAVLQAIAGARPDVTAA